MGDVGDLAYTRVDEVHRELSMLKRAFATFGRNSAANEVPSEETAEGTVHFPSREVDALKRLCCLDVVLCAGLLNAGLLPLLSKWFRLIYPMPGSGGSAPSDDGSLRRDNHAIATAVVNALNCFPIQVRHGGSPDC